MNYEIIFRVEASKDLEEIESYYSNILPVLAPRFFEEFFETLEYIEQNPNLFQVRYRGIHLRRYINSRTAYITRKVKIRL